MLIQTTPTPHRSEFAQRVEQVAQAQQAQRTTRRPSFDSEAPLTSLRRSQRSPWLVTRACLLLATAGLVKLSLFASVGAAAYAERSEHLADGNWAERAAAWIVQPDAVTVAIHDDLVQFASEISHL
jgi:hypothetical protein